MFLHRKRNDHAVPGGFSATRKRRWRFNQSPLFLEFLQGHWDLECTPWGSPTYNLFGWQKPCYLLQEGYCDTFQELLDTTDWSQYGHKSGNPKCADCMMHCGYEPTAVAETFTSWKAFARVVRLTVFGPPRRPEPRPAASREIAIPPVDPGIADKERLKKVRLPVLSR